MKKITIYKLMALFITAAIFYASCTKETSDVRLAQKLSTSMVTNISSDSATVTGFVVSAGDGFTERGVCYNTATAPTTANSKIKFSDTAVYKKATFNVILAGLNYATKYYARAYAISTNGTLYGEEINFTTLPIVPALTTTAITAITGNSASSGGNVTISGGADVTARGVCYSTTQHPTVASTKTSDGKGTGSFTSSLTGLKGNTQYYLRAYATNSAGTGYGAELAFKTPVDLPVVTTTAISAVTKTTAISGGYASYDGGGTITDKGVVWSTSANPTIADNKLSCGQGDTGKFVSNLSNLAVSTTYHARAYATNSAGTAYGSDISFTTLANITKLWIVGTNNGWGNNDNAPYILSTATNNGNAEGYAYFPADASAGFKLTSDHSWDDAHTFGDNGAGALTNPGGNITVSTAGGYYLIKANISDPANMTYSVTPTVWGVIGDATPGGWDNQTNMTYDIVSKTFTLVSHLTSGKAFKFRGTSDWSINYGSDNADGTLNAGGTNIPVDFSADYAITLDLSHPNAYTYSANRWGIIGDFNNWATPDQNMTWDPTNKVFKGTINVTTAGGFKFRANDSWTVNLGGDINALTQGGSNIAISPGNYTITFDPWALKATVTQN